MGKQKLPEHGWCFVCGSDNPHSIGLTFWLEEGVLTSEFKLTDAQQAHSILRMAELPQRFSTKPWDV